MAYTLLKLLKVDNIFYDRSLRVTYFHLSIPQHTNDSSECTDNRVNHLGLLFTLSCHSSYLSFLSYLSYFIGRLGLYPYQLVSGI
jgi:hypothetical protein